MRTYRLAALCTACGGPCRRSGRPCLTCSRADYRQRSERAFSEWQTKVALGRTLAATTECIEWTGSLSNGYGMVRRGGRPLRAHRVAWEEANGQPIPVGMMVCHHCDNPPCVNPDHLYVGTATDNARDLSARRQEPGRDRCPHGHSYDSTNTEFRQTAVGFKRRCLACHRLAGRARRLRQRD